MAKLPASCIWMYFYSSLTSVAKVSFNKCVFIIIKLNVNHHVCLPADNTKTPTDTLSQSSISTKLIQIHLNSTHSHCYLCQSVGSGCFIDSTVTLTQLIIWVFLNLANIQICHHINKPASRQTLWTCQLAKHTLRKPITPNKSFGEDLRSVF